MVRKMRHLIAILLCICSLSTTGSAAFLDVQQEDWHWRYIQQMSSLGFVNGYPDGDFRPDGSISHSEYVTILARCMQLAPAESAGSHWSAGHMQAALAAGWYDWDEIPPTGERFDAPIRRELAVKILMRAAAPELRGDYAVWQPQIRDFASLDGRYYEAVLAAYEAGIVTGDQNGNFGAKQTLTRAETCALLSRSIEILKLPVEGYVKEKPTAPPAAPTAGGVSENGWLKVIGTQLCNERGEPILLRGMSSHGLHWFPQFTKTAAINETRLRGANVFRVAMYTDEGGYIANPDAVKAQLIAAVDAAIALDMYVIIDWHILYDNNPNTHKEAAKQFFADVAARYQNEAAVLYEICNEPNGDVTWQRDIRPYAAEVIPVIRAHSPKSVVIVGTGTWSQDVDQVAAAPLPYENLMYALHFYAGTHGDALRAKLDTALGAGTPVFVTEWGTSQASGSGGAYLTEAAVWLDFLEARGISWVNWSLCDKNESSAALKPGASANGGWTDDQLSESGRFVFSRFSGK